jgi:hypothetical protein
LPNHAHRRWPGEAEWVVRGYFPVQRVHRLDELQRGCADPNGHADADLNSHADGDTFPYTVANA